MSTLEYKLLCLLTHTDCQSLLTVFADCTYLFTDYSDGLWLLIRLAQELYKLYLNAFTASSY